MTSGRRRSHAGVLLLLLLLAGRTTFGGDSPSAKQDELARRVRPVLARCVKCHSGDTPAGDLDLSTREGALREGESGEIALKPGDTAASHLYLLASTKKMPPKKPLGDDQIALLREWITA